ncbi:hypothetical protein NSB24_02115 [Blautia coccoides]|uniref:hypothetical protein n=1 Tax=Blautia producta TaxID=33035 RepID=UPI002149C6FA|nr:hypothetical protein [Blautia coccoides]MCR1985032.1 hypothetical protein [Blautia coccoides]
MNSTKQLPESCINCICHYSNLRSCRKYDCEDFPVHERVCAGMEFDANVQKALDRYEMRLKSSCRAAKEHLEKKILNPSDECDLAEDQEETETPSNEDITYSTVHAECEGNTDLSTCDSSDSDIPDLPENEDDAECDTETEADSASDSDTVDTQNSGLSESQSVSIHAVPDDHLAWE